MCFAGIERIILICGREGGLEQHYLSKVSMSDLRENGRQYFGLAPGMMRADWDGIWWVGGCCIIGNNGHLLALKEGDCQLMHIASGGSPKEMGPLANHGEIGCCVPHKGRGMFYWDQDNMMYID